MKFLLRYGEMGLKGRHVRGQMKKRLRSNVLRLLHSVDGEAQVLEEEGRLFLITDHPEASSRLGRVFGLVSFSPVQETSADLERISRTAVQLAEGFPRGATFAIRARRVGSHPFTSADVGREGGSAVLSARPDLRVDLSAPDGELHVEVRG
ncbi:MAG: THUMP domain-containing protein, partial [Thermoplasmata archaeon]|nr:THUMP domain-containing protein [Thermoplasmata archaeon]